MLDVYFSTRFKKDFKLMRKRGMNPAIFEEVVQLLRMQQPLPAKYRDHDLTGDWFGFRECHLLPDWLLIYQVQEDRLILVLSRTGSHSDLFLPPQFHSKAKSRASKPCFFISLCSMLTHPGQKLLISHFP